MKWTRYSRCRVALVIAVAFAGAGSSASSQSAPGWFLHPAFELAVFASEPDVVDPVALAFDADGRAYVVEMRDYPYGLPPARKPGGRIRLLEDTNGDGRADRSVVFADRLSFPTSIAPWKGGVIVTAPPEILYLKDTDGDGQADTREVLFSGFRLGVTDSNVNGLRWGLDNLLHGVNGGNGGQIHSHRQPASVVSIQNLDFSFDPEGGAFQTTHHTSGGFGLVFNEWGDSFVTYNINHIQQRILPVRYLTRFPGMPPLETTESISDHEEMARVFPMSTPETRPNHPEQAGHFSAAGGLGYLGPGYPGDLSGSALVCDVVGNLAHRDVLVREGPVFVARRSEFELQSEFFASRDNRCRPVGLETGPDGALYMIDMQRDVIEHPDYIPEKLRRQMNLRAGEDRGRIYRLALTNHAAMSFSRLSQRTAHELVPLLGDPNPWVRGTAQRLLVEWQDKSIAPDLREQLRGSPNPLARLHALWTLLGLGMSGPREALRALKDDHPALRRAGVMLAETMESTVALDELLPKMADDPQAEVRFQVALALGKFADARSLGALRNILLRDRAYRWSRLAVYASLAPGQETVLLQEMLVTQASSMGGKTALLTLIEELAGLAGARAFGPHLLELLDGHEEHVVSAALRGLMEGLNRAPRTPPPDAAMASAVQKFFSHSSIEIWKSAWAISKTLGLPDNQAEREALRRAIQTTGDHGQTLDARASAAGLLRFGAYEDVAAPLFGLLSVPEPTPLQLAALEALSHFSRPDLARRLLGAWRQLRPSVRHVAVALLLRKPPFHGPLLDAIEAQQIGLGELNLDLEQRRRLLRHSAPDIQQRAARHITDEDYGNRKAVVNDWLDKLPKKGTPAAGRPIFEQRCASCHAVGGIGHRVGPDLSATAHRSVEDLLSNILDPNMAIHPNYIAYTAELKNGEVETGLLQSESPEALVLLQSEGRKIVVPRRELAKLEANGLSLMPEGLENGLTPEQIRDLIAFLQSGL